MTIEFEFYSEFGLDDLIYFTYPFFWKIIIDFIVSNKWIVHISMRKIRVSINGISDDVRGIIWSVILFTSRRIPRLHLPHFNDIYKSRGDRARKLE